MTIQGDNICGGDNKSKRGNIHGGWGNKSEGQTSVGNCTSLGGNILTCDGGTSVEEGAKVTKNLVKPEPRSVPISIVFVVTFHG